MEVNKSQKIPNNFSCNICHYYTSSKKDYEKHLTTAKHKNNENGSIKEENNPQIYQCICGKICKTHGGIWKHKKKCISNENHVDKSNLDYKMIYELFKIQLIENKELKEILIEQHKQNNELQSKVLEICKNGTHNITNTNSHNKSFNLNFFLNETCKDAMNIMDFVDSVKLQLSDLETVGKIGYVEGISNIIVKNLNSLDETKRPVHCTDAKREVMYIKDENKWEKENENKQKIRKAIKHIAHKNSKMLKDFKNKHPDCDKSDSRFSDQYNKLVIEALGGKGDNDLEKEDKIIKNIAKEVTIDKNIE
jgi:hypothetical protein